MPPSTIKEYDVGAGTYWTRLIVCDRLELQAFPRTSHKPERLPAGERIRHAMDEAVGWHESNRCACDARDPAARLVATGSGPAHGAWPSGFSSGPSLALSDNQQLVVKPWRLSIRATVDPDRFEAKLNAWRQLRQKSNWSNRSRPVPPPTNGHPSMLAPACDPYTRLFAGRSITRSALQATEGSLKRHLASSFRPSAQRERILAITHRRVAGRAGGHR